MTGDLRGLRSHLGTGAFGHVHEHYPELPSTNDRALEWARQGAPHGALVSADAQTAGRGRRGRAWIAAPGEALTFSVIARPAALGGGAAGWGALGLAVGVGLREALAPLAPGLALKWPNDLLLGGAKLAGILCEARWHAGGPEALVIGVGVNVGARALPPELEGRATSLALAGADPPGRAPLLAAVLAAIEGAVVDYARGGFPAIRGRYEPYCALRGREVVVDGPGGAALHAVAEGLDDDGALRVRPRAGGPSRRVEAADVWLAAPAATAAHATPE